MTKKRWLTYCYISFKKNEIYHDETMIMLAKSEKEDKRNILHFMKQN